MRPIDADALKESLLKERDKISLEYIGRYSFGCSSPNKHGEAMRGGIRKALRCMEETPTLDYAPVKHGEWIESTVCVGFYECSQCRSRKRGNQPFFDSVWNYCPNCGAKMDGGKENDAP